MAAENRLAWICMCWCDFLSLAHYCTYQSSRTPSNSYGHAIRKIIKPPILDDVVSFPSVCVGCLHFACKWLCANDASSWRICVCDRHTKSKRSIYTRKPHIHTWWHMFGLWTLWWSTTRVFLLLLLVLICVCECVWFLDKWIQNIMVAHVEEAGTTTCCSDWTPREELKLNSGKSVQHHRRSVTVLQILTLGLLRKGTWFHRTKNFVNEHKI